MLVSVTDTGYSATLMTQVMCVGKCYRHGLFSNTDDTGDASW